MLEHLLGKKYFSVTQSSPVAKATQAAVTGKRIFVTDISGSSDKLDAKLQVIQGASTVLFAVLLGGSGYGTPVAIFARSFQTPLIGSSATPVRVEVDGTNLATANIAGFIV